MGTEKSKPHPLAQLVSRNTRGAARRRTVVDSEVLYNNTTAAKVRSLSCAGPPAFRARVPNARWVPTVLTRGSWTLLR